MSKGKPARTLKESISWATGHVMASGEAGNGDPSAFFYRSGKVEVSPSGKFRADKFTLDDVATVAIDDEATVTERVTSGGRAAGGAVAGGLLLGPAGLVAGAVVGNAAKKTTGGRQALRIALYDGREYRIMVKARDVPRLQKIVVAATEQIEQHPRKEIES